MFCKFWLISVSLRISASPVVPVPSHPHVISMLCVSGLPARSQTLRFKISRICSLEIFCLLYFLSCCNISNHFSFGPELSSVSTRNISTFCMLTWSTPSWAGWQGALMRCSQGPCLEQKGLSCLWRARSVDPKYKVLICSKEQHIC